MPKQRMAPPSHPTVRVADSLAYRITRLARLLRVNLLEVAERVNVDFTPEQWFVLNKLRWQDGQSPVELSETLFADRPNITRILQGLERRGLVRRTPDPRDGRRQSVFLTPEGIAAHDDFAAEVPNERARIFAGISQEDLDTATAVLSRIEANVKRSS